MRALPPFLLGLVLMVLLSVELGWVSAAGHGEGSNLLLPALTLGLGLSGYSPGWCARACSQWCSPAITASP